MIEIREEPISRLAEQAQVSIAFEVSSILELAGDRNLPRDLELVERAVEAPYVKDYDAAPGHAPSDWSSQFDVSNWGFLVARIDGTRIGGAVVAFDTPGLDMLDGRRDLAVLWDLRVAPPARGNGVGTALFGATVVWARSRGCSELRVETQNVNARACRFYAAQGCTLAAAHAFVYPSFPDEIQMLWSKRL